MSTSFNPLPLPAEIVTKAVTQTREPRILPVLAKKKDKLVREPIPTHVLAKVPDAGIIREMLSYMRPKDSRAEAKFIRQYIIPLGVEIDRGGNLWKRIGTAPILWSSHTDTVHLRAGRASVIVSGIGIAMLHPESTASCLGADDTAGVWLMCEMIRAKVPGLYVFHRGEEWGGIGSIHVRDNEAHRLDGIQFAVALDRKGRGDVLTHQGDVRCCSDEFAKSLAAKLGGFYKPDSTGVFTDTKHYTGLVGECSNISVGYAGAHTSLETLDLEFLTELRDKLITFNVDGLVAKRKPGEIDRSGWWWENDDVSHRNTKKNGGDFWRDYYKSRYGSAAPQQPTKPLLIAKSHGSVDTAGRSLNDLVEEYPELAADLLEQVGYDAKEFLRMAIDYGIAHDPTEREIEEASDAPPLPPDSDQFALPGVGDISDDDPLA